MLINLHLKRATALALVLGAATAGPAAARLELNPTLSPAPKAASARPNASAQLQQAVIRQNAVRFAVPRSEVTTATRHGFTSGPRVISIAPSAGFHWGDAGIGAAGGLVLSLIVLGGGLAVTARRRGGAPRPAMAA